MKVTKLLVENGVDINQIDEYGAIPLKYAITLNKLSTDDLKELYMYLLKQGSDYMHKDRFNKSCLDYAEEYSWRNDFIKIVEEFENGSK
jgi:ankyrin repeat protein